MIFPAWMLPTQQVKPLRTPRQPVRVRVNGKVYPSVTFAAQHLGTSEHYVRRRVYIGEAEYLD